MWKNKDVSYFPNLLWNHVLKSEAGAFFPPSYLCWSQTYMVDQFGIFPKFCQQVLLLVKCQGVLEGFRHQFTDFCSSRAADTHGCIPGYIVLDIHRIQPDQLQKTNTRNWKQSTGEQMERAEYQLQKYKAEKLEFKTTEEQMKKNVFLSWQKVVAAFTWLITNKTNKRWWVKYSLLTVNNRTW